MNLTKAYGQASGRVDAPNLEELAKQEATKAQTKSDRQALISEWLDRPMTKQFLSSLLGEANELDGQARELAVSFQEDKNIQPIINKLVQSATLRKVIENATQIAS